MGKRTFISYLVKTNIAGVYKITNSANGKIYIGSALDIRERWGQHCRSAKEHKHDLPFENALRKYGVENFKWELLEEVDILDLCRKTQRKKIRKRLLEAEQRWLDELQPFWWTDNGYNHNPNAYSCLGRKQTGKAAKGILGSHRDRKGIKMTGKAASGVHHWRIKWFKAIDPVGRTYTRPNLTQFCKSRNLNKGAMAAIARGTYISGGKLSKIYKGWTCEYIDK